MQTLADIKCLIRTIRSPLYCAAEAKLRKVGNPLTGEKLRNEIWGKREYKKTQEWDEASTYDEELCKVLIENLSIFYDKYQVLESEISGKLELSHFNLNEDSYHFALGLGYKNQSDVGAWWEIAERDINEVKSTAKRKDQVHDLENSESNRIRRILGQINHFYIHTYTDRVNEKLLLIRCALRIKISYAVNEMGDKYRIPVEAQIPHEGIHLLYEGMLYTRDGICILQLFNER